MSRTIVAEPLTPEAFAPFGEIIVADGTPDRMINQGLCGRYHDRATLTAKGGRVGLSLFDAEPRSLPYRLDMVERHPLGSQAFIPMTNASFLVTVAPDTDAGPGAPLAFLTAPGQAINLFANVWHGVLTPLSAPGLFAVIDRIGEEQNLEEHWFGEPFTIVGSGT
jgi:ureidoglycolate lyase